MIPPVRRTISLAIPAPDGSGRILAVLRPPDDPDLPDAWGLPAGRIRESETPEDAARRAGLEKLGVEIGPVRTWRRGSVARPGYRLEMELLETTIEAGEPSVPQEAPDVTQYQEWRWADPDVFVPAADRGSLCCRLFLEAMEGAD